MQARDIFISHASGDHTFAYQLALSLARHGFTIWFDVFDIRPGAHFKREYTQAIRDSSVFLLVLSPRSSTSTWVSDEISLALSVESGSGTEQLVPILIEDCEVPDNVSLRAYLDFRCSHAGGMSRLINELNARGLPPQSIDPTRAESVVVPVELRDEVFLMEDHFLRFEQRVLDGLPRGYQVTADQIRLSLSDEEAVLRTQIFSNSDSSDMAADFARVVEEQDQIIREGVALLMNHKFRGTGWIEVPRVRLLAGFLKCERTLCLRHLLGGQRESDVRAWGRNGFESYLDMGSDFWRDEDVVEVRAFIDTGDGKAQAPYKAVFPVDLLDRPFEDMPWSAFATYIAPFVLRDFLVYGRPISWDMTSWRVYGDHHDG